MSKDPLTAWIASAPGSKERTSATDAAGRFRWEKEADLLWARVAAGWATGGDAFGARLTEALERGAASRFALPILQTLITEGLSDRHGPLDPAALGSFIDAAPADVDAMLQRLPWEDRVAGQIGVLLAASGAASPASAIRAVQKALDLTGPGKRALLTRTLSKHPDDPYLLIERAKLSSSEGSTEAAVSDATRARSLAPGDAGIASELIWILRWADRYDEAVVVARAAYDDFKSNPFIARHIVDLESREGHVEAAIAAYRAVLSVEDPRGDEALSIAQALADAKSYGAAVRFLTALGDGPDHRLASATLTHALAHLADESVPFDRDLLLRLPAILDRLPEKSPAQDRSTARGIVEALTWLKTLPAESRALLFDASFYNAGLGSHEPLPIDCAEHYIARGFLTGRSPNPFFDPWFYSTTQSPLPAGTVPLHHYFAARPEERAPCHPLIASETASTPGEPDLLRVCGENRVDARILRGPPPESLRSRAARITIANRSKPLIEQFVTDFPDLSHISDSVISAFDPEFYKQQLVSRSIDVPFSGMLSHYFNEGWRSGIDPHPLFRTTYYFEQNRDIDGQNPFLHFLEHGVAEGRQPHPLLQAARTRNPRLSFLDYTRDLGKDHDLPLQVFKKFFYVSSYPEIDLHTVNPIIYYLSIGHRRGHWASPVLDPEFYRKTAMPEKARSRDVSPLEHFALATEPRPRPFALFDPEDYRALNDDIARYNLCASTHFVEHGCLEAHRRWSRVFSQHYVFNSLPTLTFAAAPAISNYLKTSLHRRTRILFVGHEAGRSGAPGILLEIVKHFASHSNVECLTLLDQGGALLADYEAWSHAFVAQVDRHRGWHDPAAFEYSLDRLLGLLSDNPPAAVICNSAEVRRYAAFFKARRIPVLFLMHEVAGFYPVEELKRLHDNSSTLVFPAQYVADSMMDVYPKGLQGSAIIPQGLLRETFGTLKLKSRQKFFRDHSLTIDDGDFVVLGCGTINGRKGFDLFVNAAYQVKRRAPDAKIKFLWVGGQRGWRFDNGAAGDSISYWASWDLKEHQLDDMVSVVPEVSDAEPFFAASDLFLMSSRADPFPCVVHEAMACSLPIVCFEGTTGAPEAFRTGGIVVGKFDVGAMADAILQLAREPARRAEMGESNRQRVRTEYRYDTYVEKLKRELIKISRLEGEDFGAPGYAAAKRPKVYFAAPDWGLSGVNTVTSNLVNFLRAEGYDAQVLLTAGRFGFDRPSGASFFEPDTIELPDVPFQVLQATESTAESKRERLRKFLSDNAPCILFPGYDYAITSIAKDPPPGVGFVGVTHSDDREHYEHTYEMGQHWDRIVSVSAAIEREILKRNSSFGSRTLVIRNGIEPPDAAKIAALVDEKIARANPIRIVYAGRFEIFQKRILDYCRLPDLLLKQGVEFEFVMAGIGSQFEAVQSRMARHVASGRVKLPGRLSPAEVIDLMASSHILLLLSDFEGLPISVIEGLQNGCVPLAFEIDSGIPEVVDNDRNGLIVPHGDYEAVAREVRRFAEDAALRSRLIRAALETSGKAELTASHMGVKYKTLLDDVFHEIQVGRVVPDP